MYRDSVCRCRKAADASATHVSARLVAFATPRYRGRSKTRCAETSRSGQSRRDSGRCRGRRHGRGFGWRQISALVLPGAQVLLELLLLQMAGVAADGVSGGDASSHRQRKNRESSANHGFLYLSEIPLFRGGSGRAELTNTVCPSWNRTPARRVPPAAQRSQHCPRPASGSPGQRGLRPLMTLSRTTTMAITRRTWMRPPMVTEVTSPRSHKMIRTTAMV